MRLASGQRGSPIQAIGLPRSRLIGLAIATAFVGCLHAGALFLHLDVSGSRHASGVRVMAVRLLRPHVIDAVADAGARVEPKLIAHRDREQVENANAVPPEVSEPRSSVDTPRRVPPRPPATVESPRPEPVPAAQSLPSNAALAPQPDYLLGAHLDPGPRPLGDIEPEYPESANLQEGKVVLRLLISETGVVDDVAVVRAEPKGLFDSAALEAFRVARFSPGMVLGTPVKSQITVEVEFVPINRGARISGRMY